MSYRLDLADGKYTYIFEDGKQYALRYGEPWRDLTGDKFVYCLASEASAAQELRQQNARMRTALEQLRLNAPHSRAHPAEFLEAVLLITQEVLK